MRKLTSLENLLIAVVCFSILIYHFIYNQEIILHPYMGFLIILLFGIGGWSAGVGFGKLIQ